MKTVQSALKHKERKIKMSNLQKLIDSTIINHSGVLGTETKMQRMARVIEVYREAIDYYGKRDTYEDSTAGLVSFAWRTRDCVEAIAGGEQ
jgi:hypothetical protein